MNKLLLTAFSALVLASCAPSYTAYSVKPDADLTCSDIRSEIARARSASDDATRNRGLSAQNVAWAVFFLPGIAANEYTNAQVQQKAAERIAALNRLYVAKRCAR
jgi:hypothetical protein